jgi:hypothetical protein
MHLDSIREGDRAAVIELQIRSGCDFPIPDPLTGFVVRDDAGKLIGWAGWELVAEVLGIVDPNVPMKDKVRIWSSLHKPIESEILRKGVLVAYVQVKKEQSKFAALLNWMGWKFCPGFWLRREAGITLNHMKEINADNTHSHV